MSTSVHQSPIPSSLPQTVTVPTAPWRVSQALADRVDLKPVDESGSFKRCVVLPDDPEMEFVKQYFFADKPEGLGIRAVYLIQNPAATQSFEGTLKGMEADAKKLIFQPNWMNESEVEQRGKVIERWKSMAELFGPFKLSDGESPITSAKAFPLWHGSDLHRSKSIASGGFTFFGKHRIFDGRAQGGKASSTDEGYFGSGIYFTNSARYAAMYSPTHLILAWVIMRQPYPVVNDVPHPERGTDMKLLATGKGAYQTYNAHYIPVASIQPDDPKCMRYYPCYKNQAPAWDEFVVFEKAQTVARLWIELAPDGPSTSLTQPYTPADASIAAERGNLAELQRWIIEDPKRLHDQYEGETLCYAALSGNQLPVLEWLYAQDPSLIEQCRHDKRSLPFLAVFAGRKEILAWLLERLPTPYYSALFSTEAKTLGYSSQRIATALQSVGWSIWQIPMRNPHFTGRDSILSQLEARFQTDPTKALVQVPLLGAGGMGKSTLATEYTHRFQNRYSLIWWINAEQSRF